MTDFKHSDRFASKRSSGGFGKKEFSKPGYRRYGVHPAGPQVPMHPAVCAQCGMACQVPFRPDGQRPIYCRDCLGGNKPFESTPGLSQSRRDFQRPERTFQKPAFRPAAPAQASVADVRIDDIQRQLSKVHAKLDTILLEIAVAKAQDSAESVAQAVQVKATKAPKAAKKK